MDDLDVLEDLLFIAAIMDADDPVLPKTCKGKRKRKQHKFTGGEDIVIETDPKAFTKITRITIDQFKTLLNLVEPWLRRRSRRRPIDPEQRLYITLYFLGHACSLGKLSSKFGIGLETARSVVLDTCDALWNKMSKLYLLLPNEDEWKEISNTFYEHTQLPNCIGALDGKHIKLNCPPNAVEQRANKKKFNSIILLASCDCNYCFTLVDVCEYEEQITDGAFNSSLFGRKKLDQALDLPAPDLLPASDVIFPYFFVASCAFPLKENIMKPFARVTSSNRENFNKWILNAKIRIDTAFDMLTSQWRILENCLSFSPKNAKKILLATIVLHNYIRFFKTESTTPNKKTSSLVSVDMHDLHTPNASPQLVLNYRSQLCNYLNTCLS